MKATITSLFLYLFIFFAYQTAIGVPHKGSEESLPKVYVSELKRKEIFNTAIYLGRIKPVKVVHLFSPVEGVIEKIHFKAGQLVRKGKILALIRRNEIGVQIRPVRIKAPFTGMILQPNFPESSFVAKNSKLFTLYEPKQFKLELNVTPSDAEQINLGHKINVDVESGNIQSVVQSISPNIDRITGTRRVELQLTGEKVANLMPGLMATAKFDYDHRQGFEVDNKVIHRQGERRFIRLLNGDSKVEEVDITLGSRKGDFFEIFSEKPLSGKKIIIKASVKNLMNQQKVELVNSNSNLSSESKNTDTKI